MQRFTRIVCLALILLVVSSSLPVNARIAANTTITLDPRTTYQTITGWEAVAQAGQIACAPEDFVAGSVTACAAYLKYRDSLADQAVTDLGITRLRVEVKPGIENPVDYFQQYMEGKMGARDYVHIYAPQLVNDDADPNHINLAGFQWSSLDNQIENVVIPLRNKLAARGEKLFINVCYVGFGTNPSGYYHWDQPAEYAEFVLATYQHLKAKYGLVPDAWEVALEPDNTAFNGTKMGQAIAATAALLEANGFQPAFIAPSTTNMSNAQTYFNAIKNVIGDAGVRKYISELSYHRYAGVNDAVLQWIGTTSRTYGIGASMLEHIGSGYEALHQDLKVGHNTAWEQFTLAFPVDDNGAQYYPIDMSDPQSPRIVMGSRTRFLRQYFRFIRPGAVRIGATGSGSFDPLAFINPGNKYVVVVKAASGGTFAVQGLPAGTYGLKYTTNAAYDVDLPAVTLAAGQGLTAAIPAAGVLTVYQQSAAQPLQRKWMPLISMGSGPLSKVLNERP